MRTLSLTVTGELAGRRVKSLLLHRLRIPEHMIARIKLREEGICLNGVRCRTVDTVRSGDVLTVQVGDDPGLTGAEPIDYPLTVLYEDEDIIIADKPAGMATHGSTERGSVTLANAISAHLGYPAPFHPVTRLDRGTSGIAVAAKSGYAHERLRSILHTESFIREYIAIAEGCPPQSEGSIVLPIGRDESVKNRFCVRPDGAYARTDYRVIDTKGGLSLIRLRLFTGKTHQIRIHIAAVGCPLLGDRVYGVTSPLIDRPALHSAFLTLTQPITGVNITLQSSLPDDMASLL